MRIYDISLTISPDLPVWPGDPTVDLHQTAFMDRGAPCNLTFLALNVHAGTHVDAPHHFMNDCRTIESLPLEVLTGPAYVVHFPDEVKAITASLLESTAIPSGTTRLLFRTRNSHLWRTGEWEFKTDFVAVSADGAEWLVQHGIELVGVDYLSVAPFGDGAPTHKILLGAGVVALEGLDLSEVERGTYDLYCLPLKLLGSDGAPARAILVGE
jgi:arylformamidase